MEDIYGMRQKAFENGITVTVKLSESIDEIGFDEERAREKDSIIDKLFLAPEQVALLIAFAFVLLGPLTLKPLYMSMRTIVVLKSARDQLEKTLVVKQESEK